MRISRATGVFMFALLSLFALPETMYSRDSTASKTSVVFKEPVWKFFSFKKDNTDEELWSAFMLVKKANAGEAPAQHELGLCYLTGRNFSVDTAKAVYWITKAADQNLTEARYNLGILLNNGWGVEWNPFTAFKHFRFAAEKGMPDAQYVYGLFYTDNLVVEKNYSTAFQWITRAADSGYSLAKDALEEFKKRGVKPQQQEEQAEQQTKKKQSPFAQQDTALPRYTPIFLDFSSDTARPAEDSDVLNSALQSAGIVIDTKQTASPEITDSVKQAILHSAEAGSPEALTLLGRWHELGTHLPENNVLAALYYIQALRLDGRTAAYFLWKLTRTNEHFAALKGLIDRNDPTAMYVWAELVSLGFAANITQQQVVGLMKSADSLGFAPASAELGMWNYSGKYIQPNRGKAEAYWKKAVGLGSTEAKLRLYLLKLGSGEQGDSLLPIVDSLHAASTAGSVLAQAMLGYCYQRGAGVAQHTATAVSYYRKAAERGSETAYTALKGIYDAIRPKEPEFQIKK